MSDRAPGFRIHPRARLLWEYRLVPLLLDDVVEAIFAGAEETRRSVPLVLPWRTLHMIPSIIVLGHRFWLTGAKDSAGRWTTLYEVQPFEDDLQ